MEDRFGYDGEENIWFDREKPTGEECENRGALFEEILVSEIVEEYESLRTALSESEARVRELEASNLDCHAKRINERLRLENLALEAFAHLKESVVYPATATSKRGSLFRRLEEIQSAHDQARAALSPTEPRKD